eukprot:scaffold33795_cov79-Skeletonema_marinoi.AAC.2
MPSLTPGGWPDYSCSLPDLHCMPSKADNAPDPSRGDWAGHRWNAASKSLQREVGRKHFRDGDHKRAFEYLAKAADLGDVAAHFFLSLMYRGGLGVEKDEKMELYYAEEAAIGGDPIARCSLGCKCKEGENGRYYRAVKHFIIAAKLGHDDSVQKLKEMYKSGYVSKEDFASALRGHQAAVDGTKSAQRDLAEKRLPPRS